MNNSRFYCLVDSNSVKLETSHTVSDISLTIQVTVLCSTQSYRVTSSISSSKKLFFFLKNNVGFGQTILMTLQLLVVMSEAQTL